MDYVIVKIMWNWIIFLFLLVNESIVIAWTAYLAEKSDRNLRKNIESYIHQLVFG